MVCGEGAVEVAVGFQKIIVGECARINSNNIHSKKQKYEHKNNYKNHRDFTFGDV